MGLRISIYFILSILYLFFFYVELWEATTQFLILTSSLLIFIIIENYNLYKKENLKSRILLNPIFVSGIVTFLLTFGGIVSFLLVVDGRYLIFGNFYTIDTLYKEPMWLVKTVALAGLSMIMTYLGYYMNWGSKLFEFYNNKLGYRNLLNRPIAITPFILLVLFGYFVKFYLFYNKLYGYQQLGTGTFVASRLHIFQNVSLLTFLIVCYYYFRSRQTQYKFLFYLFGVMELIFALAHGARSSIVMFFLVIIVTRIYVLGRVNFNSFILGIIILFFAMTTGLEYKHFIAQEDYNAKDPITSLYQFYQNRDKITNDLKRLNAAAQQESGVDNIAFYYAITRFTVVSETALAIRYKEVIGLQKDDPSFYKAFLTFPFFAIFPSFYLFNIPEPQWGGWFYDVVQKAGNQQVSIGFSPIGYLYLLGKIPAIIFGFFFYGVLLKFANILRKQNGLGYMILFLALYPSLYTFDTVVHSVFLSFERFVILLPLAYFILISKSLKIKAVD